MDCNYQLLIRVIDEAMVELGTSGLIDGRKVRDVLLDIRSMCAQYDEEIADSDSSRLREIEPV